MSVTSSATVSRDREVQSPDPLPDKLLVVSIAKRDGTPLDASSILEEDIVELCIGRAHTHPLGVLWYSTADSVVFLSSATDVNHTQHALLDVTEFGDEAIAIQDNGSHGSTDYHIPGDVALKSHGRGWRSTHSALQNTS